MVYEPSLTVGLLPRALDNGDLFRRQVVEFIDKLVDLAVERGALLLSPDFAEGMAAS
jgi:hypothetical protein